MNLIICNIIFILGVVLLIINAIQYSLLNFQTKEFKMLKLYLIASAIENSICFGCYYLYTNNNYFLSHLVFNVQLVFISLFYYELFQDKKLKQYVKYAAILVFAVSSLQYILKPDSFWQFNLLEIISTCCLLISFGLLNLYNTMGEGKKYFYFTLGMVMYFLCSCIVFLFGGFTVVFLQDPYLDHWVLKDLFFIVFQLLIWKELNYIKKLHHV
ncbi:MAG: hypothetical protein KA206_08470 [Paludibacter sp.]|nr:hypothetical protein [Paludibacter sp.]